MRREVWHWVCGIAMSIGLAGCGSAVDQSADLTARNFAAAVQQANAQAQAQAEVLNARLAEQITAAEGRISASRDAAMASLRSVATDTATALVTRLVGRADAAAVDGAVGRARRRARRRSTADRRRA